MNEFTTITYVVSHSKVLVSEKLCKVNTIAEDVAEKWSLPKVNT